MSSQQCQNCGAAITCGCQKRVASDGTKVCTNCIQFYEKTLADQKQKTEENVQST